MTDGQQRQQTVWGARDWLACVAWGVLAALGRLALVWAMQHHPLFAVPLVDGRFYEGWSQRMLAQGPFAGAPFTMSPLYAWLLWGLKVVGLGQGWGLRLVLCLMGGATVAGLCALAQGLGGKAARTVMGLLGLVFFPLVMADLNLMKTGLGAALYAWALVGVMGVVQPGVLRRRWPGWAWAGLCFGLAALVREPLAPVGLAVLALAWLLVRGDKTSLPGLALSLGLLLLPLLANGVGQFRQSGQFHWLTAAGGEALYLGLGPTATGTFNLPGFARPDPAVQHQDFQHEARRRTGRPLTARQADRYWRRTALRYALSRPFRTHALVLKKLRFLLNPRELPSDLSVSAWRGEFPWLRWLGVSWWLVLPVGLGGLLLKPLRGDLRWVLTLAVGMGVLLLLPFFVYDRFRLLAWLPLLPMAAAALAHWRGWPGQRPAVAAMALVGLVMFSDKSLIRTNPQPAYDQVLLGDAAMTAGQARRARGHYQKALGHSVYGLNARLNLGNLAMQGGDLEQARWYYLQVLAKAPSHAEATANLAAVLAQGGQNAQALRWFTRALKLDDQNPGLWRNLGQFMLGQKKYAAARAAFERSLALSGVSPDEEILIRLVFCTLKTGEKAKALGYVGALEKLDAEKGARARRQWAKTFSR